MNVFHESVFNSVLRYLHPYTLAGIAILSEEFKQAIETMWDSGNMYLGSCKYHFRNVFYRLYKGRVVKVVLNPPPEVLYKGMNRGYGECKNLHVEYEKGSRIIFFNKKANTYLESDDLL